ncbi:hypothetical protein AA106555_1006 [Neokomagataea thailandica NBRC 106555]|uniref:Sulfotransferase family protein n=2 Tax=Neokomagataea TaxID=1223423 RepID=A0A4Y6V8I1_9PROT|nr:MULTISPECIES: sulfotransferase family 2 domain-containing protein [Neokomagataea]QDH24787.1 hypothetical protein D5366_05640 [Neokomagataea tanensis]GBR52700.1 hypothetical protein AA106555_1006 [Neokomagataea thailandica NBRC 106555]
MTQQSALAFNETQTIADFPLPTIAKEDWLHRSLRTAFQVQQFNDIHERAADLRLPLPCGKKREARLKSIVKSGVLFVHVPKNGGTSICDQLYGGVMMHETIRYYRHVAPEMVRILPSFAIWRDPVERFVSAWSFAKKGGTDRVSIHPSVNEQYRSLHSLNDALDMVEAANSPYDLDHVFRPQHWYVCNRKGELAVSKLFTMEQIDTLPKHIPQLKTRSIPHLNKNAHTIHVTDLQEKRIRRIYAKDYLLQPS